MTTAETGGRGNPGVLATGGVITPPGDPDYRARGLRARLSPIPGETPLRVLATPLYLQAVLAPYAVSEQEDHAEYGTVSSGTFSEPPGGDENATALRTLESFDTLILWWDAPWMTATANTAPQIEAGLWKILRGKRPIELLLTSSDSIVPELRMDITFRSLSIELRAGEPDTRYATVGISEWRDPVQRRRGSNASRKKGVKLPTTHRLRNTDTLYSLSFEFYGDYQHKALIRDANGISSRFGSKDPIAGNTRFSTGQKIKIPKP